MLWGMYNNNLLNFVYNFPIKLYFKLGGIISNYLLVLLQLKLQEVEISETTPSNKLNFMFDSLNTKYDGK